MQNASNVASGLVNKILRRTELSFETDVVDGDDIGMVELSGSSRLALNNGTGYSGMLDKTRPGS
jgi:hypothetical protein